MKLNSRQRHIVRSRDDQGFTLVEVLVALVIVSLALPALVSLVQDQMNDTGYIRDKSIATWVAENQIAVQRAEYELTEKFLQGRSSAEVEMSGRTWYYEIVSEKTAQEGMWRQTVSVGLEPEQYMVAVVGFLNE